MTATMYQFPIGWPTPGIGASLDIDGSVVWAGPRDDIQFHIDRHRRLWVYPFMCTAAVLAEAIYPDAAEQLRELTYALVDNRVFISHQITREIHDLLMEQAGPRPEEL